MTDTDLITAGDSAESGQLPIAVTPDAPAAEKESATQAPASTRRGGALTSMVLPELRALAKELGIEGASGMRKGELVSAIRERRNASNGTTAAAAEAPVSTAPESGTAEPATADAPTAPPRRERRSASRDQGKPATEQPAAQEASDSAPTQDRDQAKTDAGKDNRAGRRGRDDRESKDDNSGAAEKADDSGKADNSAKSDKQDNNDSDNRSDGDQQGGQNRGRSDNNRSDNNDDDGDGRQGRRGRRFRDRRRRERGGGEGGGNTDAELREDDVVQPVAGILDVLDNYAFVRTSGYLAGPNDVYVSMNMVRKNGLRRGDAVTGAVRVPRDNDGGGDKNPRQKFNPLVRLDSVNGKPVEEARKRPEFNKLTPLYPNQRLRLETSGDKLTTRVIDLIMPIGKGQRALIVSPPKAGKTTIMQDIANAITRNNPECHLMVVLVDERPEEVTDMQRSVKGEVIASTFDRPPSDHTQAAELAIERAKRLVEQGKDVVVLLDSITRLGRAYNNASPASGRILSGGVDSTALYPPKRFLGAARNIEEGGSLTIIATAMVETGSTGDTVIFEEFKGTGNAELKLDRKIAERRVFPAVDVNPSGTRKDELLLSPDEFAIVHKLRRVLSGLDPHQAIDLLMSQLRKTKNNYEFLVQVSKNTPGGDVD
ncbi:transcription termination factor Rho [Mycobacterium sp. SMC-4]|uniref:transcription termination factor Rho n=1 Tax=Mycobacterium sp. SMC-4 TaxID=2857059 RepID=UPI003D00DBF0